MLIFFLFKGSLGRTVEETLEWVLGEKGDEQKNRAVMDIEPENFGFKEILPGEYRRRQNYPYTDHSSLFDESYES